VGEGSRTKRVCGKKSNKLAIFHKSRLWTEKQRCGHKYINSHAAISVLRIEKQETLANPFPS